MVMAVQYLHNEHVVYRDLNPENILLDRGNYIKVHANPTTQTAPRACVCTPRTRSTRPEASSPRRAAHVYAHVYALACCVPVLLLFMVVCCSSSTSAYRR